VPKYRICQNALKKLFCNFNHKFLKIVTIVGTVSTSISSSSWFFFEN